MLHRLMVPSRLFVRRACIMGTFIFLLRIMLHISKHPLNKSTMSGRRDRAVQMLWNFNYYDKALKVPKAQVNVTVNLIYDCLRPLPTGDVLNTACQKNGSLKRLGGRWNDSLEVIVFFHSHNDAGYKKTYDQYFTGSTSKTLSLAVEKLHQYPDITFALPEVCFLERWWKTQSVEVQNKLKHLVKVGRFEIPTGAWVVAEEALTHYFSFTDQLLESHHWLKQHLGVSPTVSFDLDQFSLSSSVRYLLHVTGINNTVMKRIHMGVKSTFMNKSWMNFIWRQGWDSDKNHDVFVQVEPYQWLSFADSCGPSRHVCSDLDMTHMRKPLPQPGTAQSKKPIRLLNNRYSSLHDFAEKVVSQLRLKSVGYQHGVILLPLGDDFRYSTPSEWDNQYKNMKILMKYINEVPEFNVHMSFGTVQDYFNEVQSRTKLYNIGYPVVSGDFLPFTLDHKYWSGYYSNRQYLKVLGSQLQTTVRSADILAALLVLGDDLQLDCTRDIFKELILARRELDLFQHHDAIAGTVERHVAKDFEHRVRGALSAAQSVLHKLIDMMFAGTVQDKCTDQRNTSSTFLYSVDEYSCRTIDGVGNIVLLNLFTQERKKIFCIKTTQQHVQIISEDGQVVPTDRNQEKEFYNIYFEAVVPPLSLVVYTASEVVDLKHESSKIANLELQSRREGHVVCENPELKLAFTLSKKLEINICNIKENFCTNVSVSLNRYTSSGGAYTFPNDGKSITYLDCEKPFKHTSNSKLCSVSVQCQFCRLDFVLPFVDGIHGKYLQVFAHVDLSDHLMKGFSGELALRIESQIQNGRTFYTDSNGLYLQRRSFRKTLPFSASVFPMTSQAVIEDRNLRLSVHSAQPHGVVGRNQGTLDIILDRVATVREPGLYQEVDDNQPTVTKFYVLVEKLADVLDENSEVLIPSIDSVLVNDHILHPVFSFFIQDVDISTASFTFLKSSLPPAVLIANMKCFTTDDLKLDSVSLTLFKRLSLRGNDFDRIYINDLFKSVRRETQPPSVWAVHEMLPTHLQTLRFLSVADALSMKVMDIKTVAFL